MQSTGKSINNASSSLSTGPASFLVPERVDEPELLDQGAGNQADVRTNLEEMWRINVLFGGLRSLTYHLNPLLRKTTRPLRIVDVGTGSGRLPLYLMRLAQRHKLQVHIYPLDLSARNLAVAQENINSNPAIHLVKADALALPFAENAIDYYLSSLVLHHFPPDELIQFLSESYRLAKRGIIMNDIVRGYLPLSAFRHIQPFFARHFLTRHDGILSIRRAYTVAELRELAQAAGIENARAYSHLPWRMTLVAEKPNV
jgi:ubiquinone/menaquinone biosynthesis C-methylase UbiE